MNESLNNLCRHQLEQTRDAFGLLLNGAIYLRGDELPSKIDWQSVDCRRLNRAERRYAVGKRGRV